MENNGKERGAPLGATIACAPPLFSFVFHFSIDFILGWTRLPMFDLCCSSKGVGHRCLIASLRRGPPCAALLRHLQQQSVSLRCAPGCGHDARRRMLLRWREDIAQLIGASQWARDFSLLSTLCMAISTKDV